MSLPASAGPAGYWSEDHKPSPSQYRTIAVLAVELLGATPPGTRLDASVLISRLQQSLADQPLSKRTDDIPC